MHITHFLNLTLPSQTTKAITGPAPSPSTSTADRIPTGAIIGGVIAGVVVLGVLVYTAVLLYRRRRQNRPSNYGYVDAIKPTKRGDIVSGLAPGAYEPYMVRMPDQSASMAQPELGQNSVPPPMTRESRGETVLSSPLLPGDSIFTRSSRTNGMALPASTEAFAMGHQAEDSRGSAYFRQQGSVSDLGPSASQVGPIDSATSPTTRTKSSASPGASTIASPFHVRNTSQSTSLGWTQPSTILVSDIGGTAGTSPSASPDSSATSQSPAILRKQTVVQDELRIEVDNLRREMERLREERFASGSTVTESEAPPSYF